MSDKLLKVKLKGNESFNIREGWLRKGMRCIEEYDNLFSRDDAMEILGVGSKMVKSIRFWLQATNLAEETINTGSSRTQKITNGFGQIIEQYDPYFEDIFTLWIIHYQIVKNETFCMAWHLFYNEYSGMDFTKDDMYTAVKTTLEKRMDEGVNFSEKSLADDCSSIIKTYLSIKESGDPEENLGSPLCELGLIKPSNKLKNGYIKSTPHLERLDKLAVLYVIVDNITNGKSTVSIEDLLNQTNNIGKVFNLNRMLINEYLDQLRISSYLTINRTAGLDMVYFDAKLTCQQIMHEYYNQ